MLLVPALAVVQFLKYQLDLEKNNSTGLRARQEMNFRCQELVETCKVFASSDDNEHECGKLLEYGQVCLYPLALLAS